jgi:hypothetical protein
LGEGAGACCGIGFCAGETYGKGHHGAGQNNGSGLAVLPGIRTYPSDRV